MEPIKLNQRTVSSAKARIQRYDLWDDDLPGLGLRVSPAGHKTFILRYRANGGGRTAPRRFITLGRYGVLTVEEARAQAKKLLAVVRLGGDPASALASRRKGMTVATLIDVYRERGISHLKPTTARLTLARLTNHVVPVLGKTLVADVKLGDVERLSRMVEAGGTRSSTYVGPRTKRIVTGGAGAATKVVRDLSAVFSFAMKQELADRNPCALVRKRADGRRTRHLSPEEIGRLATALQTADGLPINPKAVTIVRLLALTGCRKEEIAGLKWSEVDFERGVLVLEDTKTGRSFRPLAGQAIGILETVPKGASPYVFPAERGAGSYSGLKRVWPELMKLARLENVTPHTLRHTLGSIAASSGESLLMVGALLGHANARSTSIYAHMHDTATKAAAERVDALIPLGGRVEADLL